MHFSKAYRVVQNPISGKILIIPQAGCNLVEVVRETVINIAVNPDLVIEMSFDCGKIAVNPGEKPTAVELYTKMMQMRGWKEVKSYMFDVVGEKDGVIQVVFGKHAWINEHIFTCAMEAAMLSAENGGKKVAFEFRGRTVEVDSNSKPEEVEKQFPADQRDRGIKPERPKFTGYGYKK